MVVDPRVQFGSVGQVRASRTSPVLDTRHECRLDTAAAALPRGQAACRPTSAPGRASGATGWATCRCGSSWPCWCWPPSPSCSATTARSSPRIDGQWYAPMFSNPSETALGGDFDTPTDWKDPFIAELLAKPGNWALITLQPALGRLDRLFQPRRCRRARRAPSNWLGTDGKGRDMVARLLYGFRVSIWFALALTVTGTLIGIAAGRAAGLLRRPRRPRAAALHRDLGRGARALPADHLRLDLRALAAAAADPAVACGAGWACRTTCAPSSCATAASNS